MLMCVIKADVSDEYGGGGSVKDLCVACTTSWRRSSCVPPLFFRDS